MKKTLLCIFLFFKPIQVFCFPEIPENRWEIYNPPGLWIKSQFTSTHAPLQVIKYGTSPNYGVSGYSLNHLVVIKNISNPYHLHIQCSISDKSGKIEFTNNIKKYILNHRMEIIICEFSGKGRLIIEVIKFGRTINNASCRWQTKEMSYK